MRFTLATATGVADLDRDGHLDWLFKGSARAIVGEYALVDDAVVSIDDGTWSVAIEPTPRCLATTGDGVLVGTAEARVLAVEGQGIVRPVESFDAIPTRDHWYTPWGGPPDTRSIAVDAAGTVFVNVHVGGVWRGDDTSWTEVVDRDCDTHQVLAAPTSVVVAAAVGFGQSDDGGHTFRWTVDGLHDTYCRAVAVAGDTVLVTASDGPRTHRGAVYRRALDADAPFVKCGGGLPEWFDGNVDTFQLAAQGSIVVLGTRAGQVFVSDDAGLTWNLAIDGLDPVHAVAIR